MHIEDITEVVMAILSGYGFDAIPESSLIGEDALFDSMDLVGFIADVESTFSEIGYPLTLTSEKAMSLSNSPFKTVQTIIDFIETKLCE